MDILREFLETSTIHGLAYISSAGVSLYGAFYLISLVFFQTKSAKVLWFLVVCVGFIVAGILIGKSYKEWQVGVGDRFRLLASQSDAHRIAPHRDPIHPTQPNPTQSHL